jgi:pyruvyltransferase
MPHPERSIMEIFAWNPRHNKLPRPFRDRFIGPRTNNFGDLLGPLIVQAICDREGLGWHAPARPGRLITVGSVLHVAGDGDVIWGSGVNPSVRPGRHRFTALDVRAVRGPRTHAYLADRGQDAPAVYGDPALLLPDLFPVLARWSETKAHDVTVVPNLHDWDRLKDHPRAVNPRSGLWHVLRTIAQSELVIASSLHGVIVAEALGISATLLSGHEKPLKYQDYYGGTGRPMPTPAVTLDDALRRPAETPDLSGWDRDALYRAFPTDLWDGVPSGRGLASVGSE